MAQQRQDFAQELARQETLRQQQMQRMQMLRAREEMAQKKKLMTASAQVKALVEKLSEAQQPRCDGDGDGDGDGRDERRFEQQRREFRDEIARQQQSRQTQLKRMKVLREREQDAVQKLIHAKEEMDDLRELLNEAQRKRDEISSTFHNTLSTSVSQTQKFAVVAVALLSFFMMLLIFAHNIFGYENTTRYALAGSSLT